MSSGRIGNGFGQGVRPAFGLQDAQPFATNIDDYVRKGAYFQSLTGVAITRMGNGDMFYAVDTTSANVTVTLPTVGDEVGRHHFVKRISGGSNQCNIVASDGSAILDGSATHSIAAQYGVRCYFSDGTAWRSTAPNATAGSGEVTSGTYTPTLTNVANLDGNTPVLSAYLRVGSVVTVSGIFNVDPTAAAGTLTTLGISLPIASDFTTGAECGGVANAQAIVEGGAITADVANNRAELNFAAVAAVNHTLAFTFTYRIV